MHTNNKILTSESVTIGHPDKLCDFIADSILDAVLAKDGSAHVACEVTAAYNRVNVFGEISSRVKLGDRDYEAIVRKAIRDVGYVRDEYVFTDKCEVNVNLKEQSPEINDGVSHADGEIGAGDQGFMFGYASRETEKLMPFGIDAAHALSKKLTVLRRNGDLAYLRPDGKTQVTVEYDAKGNVKSIPAIVVSAQTDDDVTIEQLREDLLGKLVFTTLDPDLLKQTRYYVNPAGKFTIGGPAADSGLTGRKIMVDTYGPYSHHGGGAFSGKDPTKVDRSAAYMLRRIAKNIVHHGLADKAELQVSYSIGHAEPVSLCIDTFGTGKVSDEEILGKVRKFYSLKPRDIISFLELDRPQFAATNDGGAFGNDFNAAWEKIDEDFI